MGIIIGLCVVVALAVMIVVHERQSAFRAKNLLKEEQQKIFSLEGKIDSLRVDLKKSKEELERGKTALRDARELTKKKLRRQSQDESDNSNGSEAVMTTRALEDSNKALSAMEVQIEQLREDQQKNESAMRTELEHTFKEQQELKNAEIAELKKKLNSAQEEVKKQKRMMRPEGNKIDLKTLPDDAACEFARLYRKAEQHERLHGIARAKLHLAQEKFTELQKRYFSVCRELAVSAGKNENIEPLNAREVAEKIVAGHTEEQSQGEASDNKA